MSRTLSVGMQTAVAAENGEFIHFIELAFSSATKRLSTGVVDMAWNSETWEAVGGALAVDTITETPDLSAGAIDLTLSGVDQAILAVLLSELYVGRTVKVWLAHLNPAAGTIIADPVLMFSGYMNGGWTIEENRPTDGSFGTVTVKGRCVGRLAGLDLRKGIQTNLTSHQAIHPGDLFFTHTQSLASQPIIWRR